MTTNWTDVAKPTGTSFTKLQKPSGFSSVASYTGGTPIGMLLALTYSTVTYTQQSLWSELSKPTSNWSKVADNTSSWTNVTKASGSSWNKITKAT